MAPQKKSIRFLMLLNMFGVFAILIISTGYVFYSTTRMQNVVTQSFDEQRNIKDIQTILEDFQTPLLEYLSHKSSSALSELLILSQRIEGMLPVYATIPSGAIQLREYELYRMIYSFIELADIVIVEKRKTDVSGYTAVYDEMRFLYDIIQMEVSSISNLRLADQLEGYEEFILVSKNIHFWNLIFILFVSFFSAIIISQIVTKITAPMIRLSGMATEISAGHFDIEDIGYANLYEIDHVVEAFNRMKKDIESYIEELRWQRLVEKEYLQERVRNMRMEEMIKRMELYTLQAQMNPHFLFNTLNTGVQLAIVEGAERTSEYMEHLALLLRHNLRGTDVVCSLRHEIEGLQSYFYILSVRFSKNLELLFEYPENFLDSCFIPSSLLQPLVENCVVHAFKGGVEKKMIAVRCFVQDSSLILTVSDNGCGMSEDTIKKLFAQNDQDSTATKITGLENVIHRLQFFYPDTPDVIVIDSKPDHGTNIQIRIDMEKKLCIES